MIWVLPDTAGPSMLTRVIRFTAFVVIACAPQCLRAEIIPGLPYERMETTDANGEKVTFYITHPDQPAPLALAIQGPGCAPLFEKNERGKYEGRIGVSMKHAAQNRVTILAVEKPFTTPKAQLPPDKETTSAGCSPEFLETDTFENRLQQILAALNVAKDLPWVKAGPVLVIGETEGAIIAPLIARNYKGITNIALLGGVGTPGLWTDIAIDVLENAPDFHKTEDAVQKQEVLFKEIIKDNSVNKWYYDRPYRYWSSFFRMNPMDDILNTNTNVYVFQIYQNGIVYMLSTEVLVSALQAKGRNVVVRRETSFDKVTYDIDSEYTRIVDWFLTDNGLPLEPLDSVK